MSLYDRLKAGRPKHPLHEEVLKLRAQNNTYDAISLLLNMHRQTVASICQKVSKRPFKGRPTNVDLGY